MSAVETHNGLAPAMVIEIVKSGERPQDALILLESIVAGVCTYVAASTTSGMTPHAVFALLAAAMPDRLDDLAAGVLSPAGRA